MNWWKIIFMEKTLADCLLVLPKDATPPHFADKTFANSHKTSKFVKVSAIRYFNAQQNAHDE